MAPVGEPEVVAWYRPGELRALARIAIPAAFFLCCGVLMVGLALFTNRLAPPLRAIVGIAGALCTLGGPLYLILGFHGLLARDDLILAVRTDGLLVRLRGLRAHVSWEDLAGVRHDAAADAILVERRGAEPLMITDAFIGIGRRELAARLEQARRRALHHLPLRR